MECVRCTKRATNSANKQFRSVSIYIYNKIKCWYLNVIVSFAGVCAVEETAAG